MESSKQWKLALENRRWLLACISCQVLGFAGRWIITMDAQTFWLLCLKKAKCPKLLQVMAVLVEWWWPMISHRNLGFKCLRQTYLITRFAHGRSWKLLDDPSMLMGCGVPALEIRWMMLRWICRVLSGAGLEMPRQNAPETPRWFCHCMCIHPLYVKPCKLAGNVPKIDGWSTLWIAMVNICI